MKILSGIAALILSSTIILSCGNTNAYAEESEDNTPYIGDAKSVIVTECGTGQVLFENNSSEKLPMASVTKLMCMLIWAEKLENGDLSFDDTVTASAHANSMDGAVIWLETGEQLTVRELVKSVVIASANDACVAICEHIAGSEENFVKLMNDKAKSLGMASTSYKNCVGFDEDGHYTTAYDISLLCAEISRYSYYDEFFNTRLDYVREGERQTQLLNTNKLMRYYNGIKGGKTGTTDNAGCCLAVWAKRGNMTVCAVELSCTQTDDRFDICESLLDYGFNNFSYYKIKADSSKLKPIEVENGLQKEVDVRIRMLPGVVIPKGSSAEIEYSYTTVEKLTAPVEYGQIVGNVTATLYGKEIYNSDIIAVKEIEELTFIKSLLMIFAKIFSL